MRTKIIVNAKFQWTVVAYSVVISILTTSVQYTAARLEAYAAIRAQSGLDSSWPRFMAFAALVFGYLCIVSLALVFSNRLAGPLYRLREHMKRARETGSIEPVSFRKYDYYSDLKEAYNRLLTKLPRSNSGFTLPEVMVVIAIGGMLAAMAASSLLGGPQASLLFQQDKAHLQDILQMGRNAAITKNECAIVTVVDPVTVMVQSYPIPSPCTAALPPPDMQMIQTLANSRVTNFNTGAPLVFKPGGGTTAGVPVTLLLTLTAGNLTSQFTVYPAIGQIRHL